jgi:hypothetical protein
LAVLHGTTFEGLICIPSAGKIKRKRISIGTNHCWRSKHEQVKPGVDAMITIFNNFWRKNWRFSQKPMLWSKFAYFSFVSSQKCHFFRWIFRRKYLKNHNIGPWFTRTAKNATFFLHPSKKIGTFLTLRFFPKNGSVCSFSCKLGSSNATKSLISCQECSNLPPPFMYLPRSYITCQWPLVSYRLGRAGHSGAVFS